MSHKPNDNANSRFKRLFSRSENAGNLAQQAQKAQPNVNASSLAHQIEALYTRGREFEAQRDISAAEPLYREVVRLCDGLDGEPSLFHASSLYQLGCMDAASGRSQDAINQVNRAAEVFRRVALNAEVKGNIPLTQGARAAAKAAWEYAEYLSGNAFNPQAEQSPLRAEQVEFIQRLHREQARTGEMWAQGLGHI